MLLRAGHPEETLVEIHDPLLWGDYADPICGLPAVVHEGISGSEYRWYGMSGGKPTEPEPESGIGHVQCCPACPNDVSKPDIMCADTPLQYEEMAWTDSWLDKAKQVDLMLIVGTSARSWPAVELVDRARNQGARIAVFNTELDDQQREQLRPQDWLFLGDPAVTLPVLLGAGV